MQQKKPNKKRGKKNEKNWQITDNSNGDFDVKLDIGVEIKYDSNFNRIAVDK